MEKKLTITVSGQAASGKSRLTYLLKNFLREQGFNVELECGIDHPTESNFDMVMGRNIDSAVQHIKETRKITIRENQTQI